MVCSVKGPFPAVALTILVQIVSPVYIGQEVIVGGLHQLLPTLYMK